MTCGHGSMIFYGNVAFAAAAMWGDWPCSVADLRGGDS